MNLIESEIWSTDWLMRLAFCRSGYTRVCQSDQDGQQDSKTDLGQSPMETAKARKRLKLSKLGSHSIVGKLQCEHIKLSDTDDFIAELNDGNDEVAAIIAVVAIAMLIPKRYLSLALLLQMVCATGRCQ